MFCLHLDQVMLIQYFFLDLDRIDLIKIQNKNYLVIQLDPNPEYKILDQHYLIQIQSQNFLYAK